LRWALPWPLLASRCRGTEDWRLESGRSSCWSPRAALPARSQGLQISPKTVETFRAILLGKTRAKNSVQLVLTAQALGWLDLLSTPHPQAW